MPKVVDEVDKQVAARLKQARFDAGISQEKLATALGVTFQQVQKYESGTNRVSASRLKQASETLGVGLDYFYAAPGGDDGSCDGAGTARMRDGLDPGLAADGQRLARAFQGIKDARVRRDLLRLVETMRASLETDQEEAPRGLRPS